MTSSLSTYKVRHLYHLGDRSIVSLSELMVDMKRQIKVARSGYNFVAIY